jgi:hypothetical protein
MGVIVASNLVPGERLVFRDAPKPVERNGEGSFQALREKIEPQETIIPRRFKIPTNSVAAPPPNKIREVDDTLIQYKESAFLSDMLSSSKD